MTRVWDPAVRLFHWSLVASFAIAYLTAEEIADLHIWAGYAVASLITFRIVWGFVGPRYARFGQFVRDPGTTLSYLGAVTQGREPRYLGHNPAGAAMILAMLLALAVTSWTGWTMTRGSADVEASVQVGGDGDDDAHERNEGGEGGGEELHELAANLMLGLVLLHLAGVVLASRRHNENLARAMITGDKRAPAPGDIA